jgi:UDP-glucose 4-epimerase
MTHQRENYEYVGTPRRGDHRRYISDFSKARENYSWSITRDLGSIFDEILGSWRERRAGAVPAT